MNAVILAGGFGNRLMPFTSTLPKPMLNIANTPMIDYSVSQLAYFGINNIIFTLAFLPDKIIDWTKGYEKIKCRYNIEKTPLGTCGGIKVVEDYLDDLFFVLSGDGISNINLNEMLQRHLSSHADITIAVTDVKEPSLYGVVDVDADGFVRSFVEKPKGAVTGSYINCGTYLIDKKVFSSISNGCSDFSKNLFPDMLKSGRRIGTYIHNGYWNDVGSINSYYQSNFDMKSLGEFFPFAKNSFRKNYNDATKCSDGVLIGKNSTVFGCVKNSIIGNNCIVMADVMVENSIILDDTVIVADTVNMIINHSCAVEHCSKE